MRQFNAAARQKDEARLEAQRADNLRRMQGLAGATGGAESKGEAQRDAGPSASYAGRIQARVRPKIVFTDDVSGNPNFSEKTGYLDAKLQYRYSENITISLEGKNLTDRPFVTFQNNDPRQVIDYQRYGREYYLGMSYKF